MATRERLLGSFCDDGLIVAVGGAEETDGASLVDEYANHHESLVRAAHSTANRYN